MELSDLLCLKAKMGSGNNGCAANAEPLRQMVRLSGSEMEYILDELKQQRANMEEFLEIMK